MSNTNAAFAALIQTAAMSLEVTVTDSGLSYLVEESERYLKDFINQVSVVCLVSRSSQISKQDFAKVLKSRGDPPLLGYEPNLEQNDLISKGEYFEQQYKTVPLSNYTKNSHQFYSRKIPLSIRYSLVDGVKCPVNGIAPKPRSDRSRADSPDCVSAVLSKSQIDFIVETLNYMRKDTNNTFNLGLKEILEREEKITIFVPYFLHIITAKMTEMLHNIDSMTYLLQISLSLASNPFLDLMTYFFPFLRVCMTALIASDVGSNNTDDDSPVRKIAAELLHILHVKCRKGYPIMTTALFNYLIGVLFNTNTSIAAHIGCIYGFMALGVETCEKTLIHIPGYLSVLRAISNGCNFEKCYQGRTMVTAIREMCEKIINETKSEENKYRSDEILQLLSTIVFRA